jgi:hypothetical protein
MEDIKRNLANKLLQKFINGSRSLDDEEFCMDRLGLYGAAEHELSSLVEQYGEEAFEELSAMHPEWSLERRILLSKGETRPSFAEVTDHTAIVLANDDHGQFIIMVGKFPLRSRDETIGWVVIREAGISLDREYEIAGILKTEAEALLFIERKFEMDMALS